MTLVAVEEEGGAREEESVRGAVGVVVRVETAEERDSRENTAGLSRGLTAIGIARVSFLLLARLEALARPATLLLEPEPGPALGDGAFIIRMERGAGSLLTCVSPPTCV